MPGVDTTAMPPLLRALFDAWLDREVASIERINALVRLDRQIRGLLRQIEAAEVELRGAADESRLARLAPRWALASLDAVNLGAQVDDFATFMRERLYPVLELRFPSVSDFPEGSAQAVMQGGLTFMPRDDGLMTMSDAALSPDAEDLQKADLQQLAFTQFSALNTLLEVDFEQPMDIHAAGLEAFGEVIRARLETAQIGSLQTDVQSRRVVFVNPTLPNDLPGYAVVDVVRGQRAWSELLSGEDENGNGHVDIVLEVIPEDLSSGASALNCDNTLPVIEAMGLVAIQTDSNNTNRVLNNLQIGPDGQAEPVMAFATEEGLRRYTFPERRHRDVDLQLLFANILEDDELFRTYVAQGNKVGEGLSPFGTFRFQLDLDEYAAMRTQAPAFGAQVQALILLFDIDYRPAERMTWLGPCWTP